jgi:anti-sigma-K factor RskA
MDDQPLHDLTAAYVLDALDPSELEAFEEHLASCTRCREEVRELAATAGPLAYAVPAVSPPPALRARILDAARAERPNVIPLRPRWAAPVAAIAAVAACAAIGLGVWDVSLHDQLAGTRSEALVRIPVTGASGSVVLGPGGAGALVLADLAAAPAGRTYEAWVVKGHTATPAGLFRGGDTSTIVPLSRPVPAGGVVAVTVEPAGGSTAPTRTPFIVSDPID